MLEYHHFSVGTGPNERLHMIVRETSRKAAMDRLLADDPVWWSVSTLYEGRAEVAVAEAIAWPSAEHGRFGEPCFYHGWVV
jgi:hypothetical protein